MNKTKLEILEQTTAPRIILFLNKKEKASITEIFGNIHGSQSAKYSALKLLNENKIIEQSQPERRTRRIDISLTEKGKEVAEYLAKIEQLLWKTASEKNAGLIQLLVNLKHNIWTKKASVDPAYLGHIRNSLQKPIEGRLVLAENQARRLLEKSKLF